MTTFPRGDEARPRVVATGAMDDRRLRHEIYAHLAATGAAPSVDVIAGWLGDPTAVGSALQRLHDDHALVLDSDGSIRMALPFSAIPTNHRVVGKERSWWANCAWDALAIPAACGIDAEIDARWHDTGEPVDLRVVDGEVQGSDGFVHFSIPAARWWDDIIET